MRISEPSTVIRKTRDFQHRFIIISETLAISVSPPKNPQLNTGNQLNTLLMVQTFLGCVKPCNGMNHVYINW